MITDVSEKRAASVFMVYQSEETVYGIKENTDIHERQMPGSVRKLAEDMQSAGGRNKKKVAPKRKDDEFRTLAETMKAI
jgi:hypothetical protein